MSSISLGMYSVFSSGIAMWLICGLLIKAWLIVLANIITLALATAILLMQLRFRQGRTGGPGLSLWLHRSR